MFKIILMLLAITVFSAVAYAKQSDDSLYKDWNNVVSLLKSKGIEASKINWAMIEPACAIIKSIKSDTAYNECRFRRAWDQNQYEGDTNYCNAKSKQKYFEFIKPSITSIVVRNIKGELITATEEKKVEFSQQEADDFKNSAFVECMHGTGWSNPDSWLGGKTNASQPY